METGKINIGWYRLNLREYIRPRQCFQCYKFGHVAKKCSKQGILICMRCGEEGHKMSDCAGELSCGDCQTLNLRLQKKVDIKHGVRSKQCKVYLRELDFIRRRRRTNYGENVHFQ
ncbi:hypothetical protein AVEN_172792-1 [Araneus ventricosus]|uniref:CCHC-type domain-containing protein n=1 Tax=Araneus ventricosus TaxID=182803 RepID=A0A4Y2BIL9_ARAVE|nr:hypothetical protein AVEN_172792-1 [Araneus ventricosus]